VLPEAWPYFSTFLENHGFFFKKKKGISLNLGI